MIALGLGTQAEGATFAQRQGTASRVVDARARLGGEVRELFEARGVPYPAPELLLRAFKREGELELWAAPSKGAPMVRIKTFAVCAASGELGPKRQLGDLQVPEGFYVVDRYNAWSSYHLSLGINYPNEVDRMRGAEAGVRGRQLGGNIFIHGDCVTIGCIPIEDGPIEELYLAALDTRLKHGGRLQVHIFPGRLDDGGLQELIDREAPDDELRAFWKNLKEGYDLFEREKRPLRVRYTKSGRYRLSVR